MGHVSSSKDIKREAGPGVEDCRCQAGLFPYVSMGSAPASRNLDHKHEYSA